VPDKSDDSTRGGPLDGADHPAFPESTARTMRILPIAANLLPLEIRDSRHTRKVRRLVITVLVGFLVLITAWYGMARYETSLAKDDLTRVEDSTRGLNRQQNAFSDLAQTRAESNAISQQLTVLLADDLRWSTLLVSLRSAAPARVEVDAVTGALNPANTATADTPTDTIGSITLTGTAPSKAAVAAYVDALGKVSGLANPFPTSANEEEREVSFTVTLDITRAALGGRYTPASASPSGGK
jgi:Tfp pilus assembly protein PilN